MKFSRRCGQVVIPALFLFPTFMLFVYLIYETAKLSREKIRHQFAIDAAVFVEMTNYSDFLNRTAYVNGAFPMRIFDEGFKGTMIPCETRANCQGDRSLWEIMCCNGDFPVRGGNCDGGSAGSGSGQQPHASKTGTDAGGYTSELSWDIKFGSKGGPGCQAKGTSEGSSKNSDPHSLDGTTVEIISLDNANSFWLNWDDAVQVYKLYVQIYSLLGSVEDAQYSVLKRLAADHNFLKKSYWLNTGDSINDAQAAAHSFGQGVGDSDWMSQSGVKCLAYSKLNFFGLQPHPGNQFMPYSSAAPEHPIDLPSSGVCNGLFHLMWIKPQLLKSIGRTAGVGGNYGGAGVEVGQPWLAPKNYFNYDFNNKFHNAFRTSGSFRQPAVHVSVAIDGFKNAKAAVWPEPTPKFQVRSYP